MVRFILLFFSTFDFAFGFDSGLRVKFGLSKALANIDYLYDIPRNVSKIKEMGWQETIRPPGYFPQLKMFCAPGRKLCPLYNSTEQLAGVQIALPVTQFKPAVINPEKQFVKWHVPGTDGQLAADYWTITQYYMHQESKATAENGGTLQSEGVWVAGPNGQLMEIPSNEEEILEKKFVKQSCIPYMGTHYYYNLSKNLSCEEFYPWFPLYKESKLIGLGLMTFGTVEESSNSTSSNSSNSSSSERTWFEPLQVSDVAAFFKGVMPNAPDCLPESFATFGCVMMHVYFIDDPWDILCSSADSVPTSVMANI